MSYDASGSSDTDYGMSKMPCHFPSYSFYGHTRENATENDHEKAVQSSVNVQCALHNKTKYDVNLLGQLIGV